MSKKPDFQIKDRLLRSSTIDVKVSQIPPIILDQ